MLEKLEDKKTLFKNIYLIDLRNKIINLIKQKMTFQHY